VDRLDLVEAALQLLPLQRLGQVAPKLAVERLPGGGEARFVVCEPVQNESVGLDLLQSVVDDANLYLGHTARLLSH